MKSNDVFVKTSGQIIFVFERDIISKGPYHKFTHFGVTP